MLKPDLYHKTVNILFDAYFNDTLEHGNCYACAVGNIIAANCGYSFLKINEPSFFEEGHQPGELPKGVYTGIGIYYWEQESEIQNNAVYHISKGSDNPSNNIKVHYQISATGYSENELYMIEKAFESAGYNLDDYMFGPSDEAMFNGLCNVLKVLKQIHEVEDDEPIRQRFSDHYNSLTLK